MESDTVLSDMQSAAKRLNERYCQVGDLDVSVRRRLRPGWVEEGLAILDNWTDVFEPVRWRLLFGGRWHSLSSVEQAARSCEEFLRERPDLAAPGW